jgi:plastocyanin
VSRVSSTAAGWSIRAVLRATLTLLVVAATGAASAQAATHTITIVGMTFDPATVRLAPGDRVVWLNRDLVPHTASAVDGSFESGRIDPGQQWSLVFAAASAIDYVCAYHPAMQGRLEVQ